MPATRVLGVVGGRGQLYKLLDLIQGMKNGILELNAACAAENVARTKRMLEISAY